MKIAIGSDERTHLTDAVIEDVRRRGHEVVLMGAVNILSLGQHGVMLPGRTLPQQEKYLLPWPRSRSQPRGSSGK